MIDLTESDDDVSKNKSDSYSNSSTVVMDQEPEERGTEKRPAIATCKNGGLSSQPGTSSSHGASGKKIGTLSDSAVEKAKKRAAAAAERLAKKRRLQEEKAARRAEVERNKIFKPGECMKHIKIEMHPLLLDAWYMDDVRREAAAAGCKLAAAPGLCDPALVMWTRLLRPSLSADHHGQVGLCTSEPCKHALYVCEASRVAELVRERRLSAHMATVRDITDCTLTLIVFGAKDYLKPNRKTTNSNPKLMTEIELEMALTDLLVSTGCDGVLAETPNELALMLVQYTKATAEAPYKLAKRAIDEQAEFYMRGDKRDAIALDNRGNGVERLWQQMVATLPNSSLEKARALCAKYGSPLTLHEALLLPNGKKEVASLPVKRSKAHGARGRLIGPTFAKRLHTLFTAEDGDTVIE